MRLNWSASGSSFYPKLLGTYEYELHNVFNTIIDTVRPKKIVDIGAAEGYYAVGLALRLPASKIVAFEIDPNASLMLRCMIALNRVQDRIEVLGGCDPESLTRQISNDPEALVLCDVEGYEKHLLDPGSVRGLERVDLLVEVHEHLAEGTADVLRGRFADTHDVVMIRCHLDRSAYRPQVLPYWKLLPANWRFRLTNERTVETPWLWMRARRRMNVTE